jgi:hypothetical protein
MGILAAAAVRRGACARVGAEVTRSSRRCPRHVQHVGGAAMRVPKVSFPALEEARMERYDAASKRGARRW